MLITVGKRDTDAESAKLFFYQIISFMNISEEVINAILQNYAIVSAKIFPKPTS